MSDIYNVIFISNKIYEIMAFPWFWFFFSDSRADFDFHMFLTC